MSTEYHLVADVDGIRTGRVVVTLTNTAPSQGLPFYVIGDSFTDGTELPMGTNRTLLSVYTAMPMMGANLDGEQVGMQTARVFGWFANTKFIDIPPGGTRTLVLDVKGVIDPALPIKVITQPLVAPELVAISRG